MKTNYVFIDLENVVPENIDLLDQEWLRLYVFVGKNQTKIPFSLVRTIQKMGSRASYVSIKGEGKNALDFHIAYYLGKISAGEPDAYFHIVSKDLGYGPLVSHLKEAKISIDQVASIEKIPVLIATKVAEKTLPEKISYVRDRLLAPSATRPRKLKTLESHIASMFQKALPETEVKGIVDSLFSSGIVHDNAGRLEYQGEAE